MNLNCITVDGFRKFADQKLYFERGSTAIAGSNNSGKTSLVDLIKIVLGPTNRPPRLSDLNARDRLELVRRLAQCSQAGFSDFEEHLRKLTRDDIPRITVRLDVGYDADSDNIRRLAPFLMDLDDEKTEFHFNYHFGPGLARLCSAAKELYDASRQIPPDYAPSTDPSDIDENLQGVSRLETLLYSCCMTHITFSTGDRSAQVEMEHAELKALFNLRAIRAGRNLDDISDDRTETLTKKLLSVTKENEDWSGHLGALSKEILSTLNSTEIRRTTHDKTVATLNTIIEEISETNGGKQDMLRLDFSTSENGALRLLEDSLSGRYMGEAGLTLDEGSQGLGYSNLVFMHLEIESFLTAGAASKDAGRVNLLVVEEPESHMHPQMQSVFIERFMMRIKEHTNVQAIITTHSTEIVKKCDIAQLRVLRVAEQGVRVVDLRNFASSYLDVADEEKRRLFSLLYSVNFADVLFADAVLMYEGDTERMYIKALIEGDSRYSRLRSKYISYVQVGGAHAHIYVPLLAEALGVRTAIVTDLDYPPGTDPRDNSTASTLRSSNATLNKILGEQSDPSIQTLYSRKSATGIVTIPKPSGLAIAFQGPKDGHARTLEEAILATLLEKSAFFSMTRKEWKDYKKKSGLNFVVPNNPKGETDSDDTEASGEIQEAAFDVQRIVKASSNNKTDFMYSLILKGAFDKSTPNYISGILDWLGE